MAVLSYNGVTLPYTNTVSFEQEALGDPQGDTDLLLVKFRITVQCLISSNYLTLLASPIAAMVLNGVIPDSPAAILAWVRSQLMQRRARLSFKVEGQELIPQYLQQVSLNGNPQTAGSVGVQAEPNFQVDVANGPVPESCTFQSLPANCFLMTYKIHASYWENYGTSAQPAAITALINQNTASIVLSNRWIENVDIDEYNRSTITRTGKYIIASNNIAGLSADWVRSNMAVLALRPKFLRTKRKYDVSADGLTLQYSITDQEQWRMPPPPAYKAEGKVWFQSAMGGSNARLGIECTMIGDNSTDQASLAQTCIGFAVSKLTQLQLNTTGIAVAASELPFLSIHLETGLFDNRATFHAVLLIGSPGSLFWTANKSTGIPVGIGGGTPSGVTGPGNSSAQGLANDPSKDTWVSLLPTYPQRGTAAILLHAAGYWDPNFVKNVDSNGYVNPHSAIPGEGGLYGAAGKGSYSGPDDGARKNT